VHSVTGEVERHRQPVSPFDNHRHRPRIDPSAIGTYARRWELNGLDLCVMHNRVVGLIGHLSHHTSPSSDQRPAEFEPELVAPSAKRTVLTPNNERDIAARYQSGERVVDLASAFDVHRATIANCLDRQGIQNRGAGPR